jgi:membrane-bound lytic murein transglycosylase MltF
MDAAPATGLGVSIMNWAAVGAIGELIAATGVIVSLVYLALQIRQNTRQLEQNERTAIATAVSVSATENRENRRYIYTSSEVTEICLKGMADPESLTESERYRFRLVIHNMVDAHWDMYSQTVITGFSPETWLMRRKVIERVLTTPGGQWFWKNFRDEYTGDFRDEIDRILNSTTTGSKS